METSRTLPLSCLLLFLAGCPSPPPTEEGAPMGPQDAPITVAAAAQPGQAPPLAVAATGPDGKPTFETIIGDGPTVTVRGTVEGASTGQVDFMRITADGPEIVHVAPLVGGKFTVTAPATFAGEIWVNAIAFPEGGQPTPEAPNGGLEQPITLAGEDIELSITIGDYDLMADKFPPPPAPNPPASPEQPDQ